MIEELLTHEDKAKATLNHIRARVLKRVNSVEELNPSDIELLNLALSEIVNSFQYLEKIIKDCEIDKERTEMLYECLEKLVITSFTLGLSEGLPAHLAKYYLSQKSAHGGRKSAKSRNEKADLKYVEEVKRMATKICQSAPYRRTSWYLRLRIDGKVIWMICQDLRH